MVEAFLAGAVFAAFALGVLLRASCTWTTLLAGGACLVAAGLGLSLLGGALYHVALYRQLGPKKLLPPRWWWHPTAYHVHLSDAGRARVLPAFVAGAAGFGLVLVGCGLVLLATWGR